MRAAIVLGFGLGLVLGSGAARAARLEFQGEALSRRQAESLLGGAMRAPGDTAALEQALGRLVASLQAAGYLEARARGAWDSVGVEPRLVVRAEPGARHRVASLQLDTPSSADSAQLAASLGIAPGDWAAPAAIAEAMTRAVRLAAESGYPYAQLAITQFDWDSSGARVRLGGSLGPEVTVSEVRFEGLRATRPGIARRALGPLTGRRFDPARAEAGRDRLVRLGLFRDVDYLGLEGEGDWTRGQLVYRVQELRYNRFEGAVGVQGERSPAGLVRLELGNLAGTGRALAMAWQSRGAASEALSARYVEPLVLGSPLRAEATLEHQREDSLFTRGRWSARLSFPLPGAERLEAGFEQDRVIDRALDVEQADLQSTLFALERDRRDAVVVPRRGSRVRLGASQTFKREDLVPSGTRKSTASAVEILLDWHRPWGRRAGVAWQASAAGRFASQPVLAPYDRYPLGGAATLRGFDEQALRVDRYGLSRLEWRWFTGRGVQHLALFWDHAWTFARLADPAGPRPEDLHLDALGLGIRIESPTGLIGVDYGLEPGRPPAEGKLHLQLVTQF
jgi:outer membrane protein assembly factor BamA